MYTRETWARLDKIREGLTDVNSVIYFNTGSMGILTSAAVHTYEQKQKNGSNIFSTMES